VSSDGKLQAQSIAQGYRDDELPKEESLMFFARHTPANLSQLRLMLDIWAGLCLTENIKREVMQ